VVSKVSITICTVYDIFSQPFLLLGLRAAQVRIIFALPSHIGHFPHPLVYLRWFRQFRSPSPLTGFHQISYSTRNGHFNAEIVSAKKVIRGCHLIPRFAAEPVDPSWITGSVIDLPIEFFLNRYIDLFLFDDLCSTC